MKSLPLLLILIVSIFSGCREEAIVEKNDEVLTYALPLDLAFLRTIEAVEVHPDWEPIWTDKEKGVIRLRNVRYSSFADADRRELELLVKRQGTDRVTVQVVEEFQAVIGGKEVLDLIRKALSEEAALRQ